MQTLGYEEELPQEEMIEQDHELLKLSDEVLAGLKKDIIQGMSSWQSAISAPQTSWDAWEAMYNDDPNASGVPPEGFEWSHFPLIRPHIRSLVASLMQAVTAHSPWVQMMATRDASIVTEELGPNGELIQKEVPGVEVMSQAAEIVHNVIQKHGGLQAIKMVLRNTFIQGGRGVLYVAPAVDDDELLEMEVIDGRNFCFDPPYVKHLWDERLMMMGHRTFMPLSMVNELIESGELYDVSLAPSSSEAEGMRVSQYTPVAGGEIENQTEHIWTLFKKCSLKKGAPKEWYRIIYAGGAQEILGVYKHDLGYNHYIDFAEEPESNKFIKAGSIAGSLSPIQHMYTNALGTLDLGSQMSAFPYMFAIGMTTTDMFKAKMGQVTSVPHGVQIQVVKTEFDPSTIPLLTEKLEEVAGTITGTSRAGTGGELSQNTTATEAQGYFMAQSKTEQGYINDLACSFERLYATVHMMLLKHPQWAEKVLYGIADGNWVQILEAAVGCRYVLAGNVLTNSVINRQQLAQTLLPLTADPRYGIDLYELGRFTIDTMADGPVKERLQKPKEVVDAEIAQQQAIQFAAMASEGRDSGAGADSGEQTA